MAELVAHLVLVSKDCCAISSFRYIAPRTKKPSTWNWMNTLDICFDQVFSFNSLREKKLNKLDVFFNSMYVIHPLSQKNIKLLLGSWKKSHHWIRYWVWPRTPLNHSMFMENLKINFDLKFFIVTGVKTNSENKNLQVIKIYLTSSHSRKNLSFCRKLSSKRSSSGSLLSSASRWPLIWFVLLLLCLSVHPEGSRKRVVSANMVSMQVHSKNNFCIWVRCILHS